MDAGARSTPPHEEREGHDQRQGSTGRHRHPPVGDGGHPAADRRADGLTGQERAGEHRHGRAPAGPRCAGEVGGGGREGPGRTDAEDEHGHEGEGGGRGGRQQHRADGDQTTGEGHHRAGARPLREMAGREVGEQASEGEHRAERPQPDRGEVEVPADVRQQRGPHECHHGEGEQPDGDGGAGRAAPEGGRRHGGISRRGEVRSTPGPTAWG